MTLSCYGREHNRLPSCSSCDMASYCSDAGDIKPLNTASGFDCDDLPTPEPVFPIDDKAMALTEVIEAAVNNPDDWRIVALKIRHPEWPLSKIAKATGFKSKQSAVYRIQRFVRIVPDVFDALMFNRNYNHGKVSERYTKETPSWDKREKIRKAKMEHPLIPGLLC